MSLPGFCRSGLTFVFQSIGNFRNYSFLDQAGWRRGEGAGARPREKNDHMTAKIVSGVVSASAVPERRARWLKQLFMDR